MPEAPSSGGLRGEAGRRSAAAPRIAAVSANSFAAAARPGEVLAAEVGEGVALCLQHGRRRRGALGVILFGSGERTTGSDAEEAEAARLIDAMLEALAAEPAAVEAHIFGGAALPGSGRDGGARAIGFVLRRLAERGVPVRGSDLAGCFPRRVSFEPARARLSIDFAPLGAAA